MLNSPKVFKSHIWANDIVSLCISTLTKKKLNMIVSNIDYLTYGGNSLTREELLINIRLKNYQNMITNLRVSCLAGRIVRRKRNHYGSKLPGHVIKDKLHIQFEVENRNFGDILINKGKIPKLKRRFASRARQIHDYLEVVCANEATEYVVEI
jgi:hypothetical protein